MLISPIEEELPDDVNTATRSVMLSKALDFVVLFVCCSKTSLLVCSVSVILYLDVRNALTDTLYGCTPGADLVVGADSGANTGAELGAEVGATILDH